MIDPGKKNRKKKKKREIKKKKEKQRKIQILNKLFPEFVKENILSYILQLDQFQKDLDPSNIWTQRQIKYIGNAILKNKNYANKYEHKFLSKQNNRYLLIFGWIRENKLNIFIPNDIIKFIEILCFCSLKWKIDNNEMDKLAIENNEYLISPTIHPIQGVDCKLYFMVNADEDVWCYLKIENTDNNIKHMMIRWSFFCDYKTLNFFRDVTINWHYDYEASINSMGWTIPKYRFSDIKNNIINFQCIVDVMDIQYFVPFLWKTAYFRMPREVCVWNLNKSQLIKLINSENSEYCQPVYSDYFGVNSYILACYIQQEDLLRKNLFVSV